MKSKNKQRLHRKLRIRAKVSGTASRPRLAVFRSNKSLYVQVIDDVAGKTLFSGMVKGTSVALAKTLGEDIASKAKKKNITTVVFDRGGYRYHGVIKAIADSVREGGITI